VHTGDDAATLRIFGRWRVAGKKINTFSKTTATVLRIHGATDFWHAEMAPVGAGRLH